MNVNLNEIHVNFNEVRNGELFHFALDLIM